MTVTANPNLTGKFYYISGIAIAILLLILLLLITDNDLLLVIVVQLVSIAIAVSIFMIAWNSRGHAGDSFIIALGASFLFTAMLDTLFTFMLIDVPLMREFSFNSAVQIWVAARYFQGFTLLVAAILAGRTLARKPSRDALILILFYAAATLLLVMSICVWQNFPPCNIHGFTSFRTLSEFVISAVLIVAAAILTKKRAQFDPAVWFNLVTGFILLIAGELVFAVSGSTVSLTIFLGFCLRFVALYFFYRAIVVIGISRPLDVLFRELRERDRALQASEERYRNVVEDQTELIARFLPDGTHVFVNEAYCRFFNMTRAEIMGKKMQQMIYPDDKSGVKNTIASLSKEKPFITEVNRILLPNGTVRWVRWTDRAIFDPSGTIVEYQSVGRDITLLQQSEEALQLAHRKLALLSSITRHDILNQLTALKSYVELMHPGSRQGDDREFLRKIQGIADVIEEQVMFMKDYESMGASAPAWQVVSASIERAAASLPLRGIALKSEVRGVEVFADPLFEKVFYNLIDNALRYGGEKMTAITIAATESQGELLLTCTDDGNGITVQDKHRLFSKGFGRHTGLGLFLVREILGITGIRISETGIPGEGARFEIRVPGGMYRISSGS